MASIRKFRGKFNVQIRRQGYPSISRTFANLTIAKRWASTTEADMERNLHVRPYPQSCALTSLCSGDALKASVTVAVVASLLSSSI